MVTCMLVLLRLNVIYLKIFIQRKFIMATQGYWNRNGDLKLKLRLHSLHWSLFLIIQRPNSGNLVTKWTKSSKSSTETTRLNLSTRGTRARKKRDCYGNQLNLPELMSCLTLCSFTIFFSINLRGSCSLQNSCFTLYSFTLYSFTIFFSVNLRRSCS